MNPGFKTGLLALLLFVSSVSFAQEGTKPADPSLMPREAATAADFVPKGWRIEEKISGHLNNDSLLDHVLTLVEDKPAVVNDTPNERQRALVILLGTGEGKLSLAAVSNKLLQCTTCGGAFYGAVEAPVHIKIKAGVLVVSQDHGSRVVVTETFRFRYEPDSRKFALIGLDLTELDRATAREVFESTNYLTGERVVTRQGGTSRQSASREKIYIEQVDAEEFEAAAEERLGLQ